LSNAVTNHPSNKPVAIAIAAMTGGKFTDDPVPPCGNCRQVIAEEELKSKKPVRIILSGEKRIWIIESSSHLLPMQFNKKNLKPDLP